jgi:hypothetical protein
MHLSRVLCAILLVGLVSFAGCGRSSEVTSVDSSELQSYVEENAAELAAEDAALEAEDAEDDDD